jgi:hypothetical protein
MKKRIQRLSAVVAVWLATATGTGIAQDNPPPNAAAPLAGTGAGGFGGGMQPFGDIRVLNAGAGIPVNGGLLIFSGSSSIAPTVSVTTVDATSTTFGGTLKMLLGGSGVFWVWTPSSPLTVGTTYQVTLSSTDIGVTTLPDPFEVLPAITIAKPAISSAPSASWRGDTNNWAWCRSLIGGILQDASPFPIEQIASVMLEPGFTTATPAVEMNQFVFRIATGSETVSAVQPSVWPNLPMAPIYEQAEQYCFQLEAIDIVTETVFSYASTDITLCAPHGDLADLGVRPIEPGAVELDRLVCHAPPEAYEEEWCELNEDPCADDAMATACGLYGFVCRDEPLPPDPFSMTGGFGGGSGMFGTSGFSGFGAMGGIGGGGSGGSGATSGGTSGMPEGGASGGGDDVGSSGGDSGSWCSVAMVQSVRSTERSTPWLASWLSALALIGARLSRPSRRTRSRAER